MKRRRVEIGAVRPDESAGLGIQSHLIEDRRILERPKEHTAKNRREIDTLLGSVVECD